MDSLALIQAIYNIDVSALRCGYRFLNGKKINMISAGSYGSGVSESTGTLNLYFNELGLRSSWQCVSGKEEFFAAAKRISDFCFSSSACDVEKDLKIFEDYASKIKINSDCDFLYVHDHYGLIAASKIKGVKKIYRCHFDLSRAPRAVWDFLRPYIESFDAVVFSSPQFHQKLNVPVFYILPSINPLSVKNTFVPRPAALEVLRSFDIPYNKPVVAQVSRFDKLKDPLGVIDAFKMIKKEVPCTCIFAGGHAHEDGKSFELYDLARKKAAGDKDIFILSIDKQDYNIAAIQSISNVIIQKSLSESFGLAVTEALWKSKPVVASDVGGIKFQIQDGQTGLLCKDIEGCAQSVLKILKDKSLAEKLGKNGHNLVKEKFLITAELQKHLEIFQKILQ